MMFAFVTHCYNTVPFRSLSALSKSEALKVMANLCDDSPFFERFKEPHQYWENRIEAETWLRTEFIHKGGKPKARYPFYSLLGPATWIMNYSITSGITVDTLEIPISIFNEEDISFTVPDSMVSYWIGRDKPEAYYQSKFHGQVFTLSEIRSLVTIEFMNSIESMHPIGTIPYVEAQIWNHEIAIDFYNRKA
ncbi:hypothetical protein MUG84_03205 [Paenibacillus sp. KQZ6P-2]|uniref:Uncharacterized protein n=1 Tax=Paenibacillus mangrovi TaxID=2931978 RepID=A0A9X1WK08_9BACL|nr:hypothetical protein [Paenibacillus mangrovi]MCJ8010752.1 hypothetical protein [Paenibacillus mangrovi]